jgi:uncharacterized Zn-finger protein
MIIHTGVKKYKCCYDGCNSAFYERSNFKKHIKTVHENGIIKVKSEIYSSKQLSVVTFQICYNESSKGNRDISE